MRPVGVAESVSRRRRDHRDVNVHFAILNRLPAPAVRPQHSHAAHFALRAVVAQLAVHRAFDVMNHSRLHQLNRTLLRRKRRARKPHQILNAYFCRRFERHQCHAVAVTQVMMVGNHHAVAQPAVA